MLKWLKAVHFEPYCNIFKKHGINGKKLDSLTREGLEEMGIGDDFHLENIMECIDELCRKKSTRRNTMVCVRVCACVRACVRACV